MRIHRVVLAVLAAGTAVGCALQAPNPSGAYRVQNACPPAPSQAPPATPSPTGNPPGGIS